MEIKDYINIVLNFIGVAVGAYLGAYFQNRSQESSIRNWLVGYFRRRKFNLDQKDQWKRAKGLVEESLKVIEKSLQEERASLEDWVVVTDFVPLIVDPSLGTEVRTKGIGILPYEVSSASQERDSSYAVLDFFLQSCHQYRESVIFPFSLSASIEPKPLDYFQRSVLERYSVMLTGLMSAIERVEKAEKELAISLNRWRPHDFPNA